MQLVQLVGEILQRADLHVAGVTEVVGPLQLEVAESLLIELVDFLCRIFGLDHKNERANLIGAEADGFRHVTVQVSQLEFLRLAE